MQKFNMLTAKISDKTLKGILSLCDVCVCVYGMLQTEF